MSQQKEVRDIIKELMELDEFKHLSYTDILNAVYWSQFGFVHDMISKSNREDASTYKSVMLRYLGSFIAHPKRVNDFVERGKLIKERKENERHRNEAEGSSGAGNDIERD